MRGRSGFLCHPVFCGPILCDIPFSVVPFSVPSRSSVPSSFRSVTFHSRTTDLVYRTPSCLSSVPKSQRRIQRNRCCASAFSEYLLAPSSWRFNVYEQSSRGSRCGEVSRISQYGICRCYCSLPCVDTSLPL